MTAQVSIDFASLEWVLCDYFNVPPGDRGKFRARVKQLQRLGFPSGVNIGRGTRMAYQTVHLFKLAIAFELLSTGLTAKPVTSLVERHWERFAAGLGATYSPLFVSSPVYAFIHFGGLDDTSGAKACVTIEDHNSRVDIERGGIDLRVRDGRVQGRAAFDKVTCRISLILSNVARRLLMIFGDAAQLPTTDIEMEVAGWFKALPAYDFFSDENNWFRLTAFDDRGDLRP